MLSSIVMPWSGFLLSFAWFVAVQAAVPECPSEVQCCTDSYTVQETTNVKYGEGALLSGSGTEELMLDVYKPVGANAPARFPVLINVHGGSFHPSSSKDEMSVKNECRQWARRGFLAIAIEYRRFGLEAGVDALLAPVHDLLAAVRYVVKNAATLAADTDNIAVFGCSAGGIIVAHANLNDLEEGDSGNPGYSSSFAVAMVLSGGVEPDLAGELPMKSAEAVVPYIAQHSVADVDVTYDYAETTQTLLNNLQVPNELITYQGSSHCGDPSTMPGETNAVLFDDFMAFALSHMTVAHCQIQDGQSSSSSLQSQSSSSSFLASSTMPIQDGQSSSSSIQSQSSSSSFLASSTTSIQDGQSSSSSIQSQSSSSSFLASSTTSSGEAANAPDSNAASLHRSLFMGKVIACIYVAWWGFTDTF